MSKDNGGPAFPAAHFDLADNEHGMSVRDFFAAKAMQAWIATIPADNMAELEEAGEKVFRQHADKVAVVAGWYADAMLKERQQ